MTTQDRAPQFSMGYGVYAQPPLRDPTFEEGPSPNAGVAAKNLHEHPFMRFLAAGAASIVGMGIAGSVLRKGGIRLATKLQQGTEPWQREAVQSIRRIRSELDKLEGIQRTVEYEKSRDVLFLQDPYTKKFHDGRVGYTSVGEHMTYGEKQRARYSRYETPVEHTLKREIQRRMVSQARRLPYELPALYITQRAVTDRLFGENQDVNVNWYNPVDVVGDFANQSVKNLAGLLLPVEAGIGATKHGWRRLMGLTDESVTLTTPMQRRLAGHAVELKTILGQVGADSADVLHRVLRFSSQSSGAMATAITESQKASIDIGSLLRQTRKGFQDIEDEIAAGKISKLHGRIRQTQLLFRGDLLDVLPGPFRGLRTGIQAGRQRYNEIGTGYDAFEHLLNLGQTRFDADLARGILPKRGGGFLTRAEVDASLPFVTSAGEHSIEQFAGQINKLRFGKGRDFREGDFYQGQMQHEYSKILRRQLARNGVEEDAIDRFMIEMGVTPPHLRHTDQAVQNLQQRVTYGGRQMFADDTNDWLAQIDTALTIKDDVQRAALVNNLERSIERADTIFGIPDVQRNIRNRITQQWNFLEGPLAIRSAGDVLGGPSRLAFEDFAGPRFSRAEQRFLQRKTAQVTGLPMATEHGARIGDDVVRAHLRNQRIDPDDMFRMRSILQEKNVIAPAWSTGARNTFGIRPLSVQEAVGRGYFRQDPDIDTQIQHIVRQIGYQDPVAPGMQNIDLGGVYQTQTGQIIDFGHIKRRFRSFMDQVSNNTQIPLIHTSPLQLLGYGTKQDLDERAILQYVSGSGKQPFLGPSGRGDPTDFYLWTRSGRRGSKGNVFAVGYDERGLAARVMPGKYRPYDTGSSKMASRQIRLAAGDRGLSQPNFRDNWKDRLRKLFQFDMDQQESIFRYGKRLLNRKSDIRNPVVMSKLLNEGAVEARSGRRLTLHRDGPNSSYRVVDQTGAEVFSAREFADAFDEFTGFLSPHTWSPRTLKQLEAEQLLKDNPELRDFTHLNLGGLSGTTFVAPAGGRMPVSGLHTPAQLVEGARLHVQNTNARAAALSPDRARALRIAQNQKIWSHIDKSTGSAYWNREAAGHLQVSRSVHTREDAFRSDFYEYLAIEKAIMGSPGQDSFAQTVSGLIGKLRQLKSEGALSAVDFAEAQAAALSMQINFGRYAGYGRQLSPMQIQTKAIEGLRSETTFAPSALSDVAAGRLGESYRWYTEPLAAWRRRNVSAASYDFIGQPYNPFGPTNTVFVPTARTAMQRNPLQASLSMAGVNTWSNPDAFSGSAIPVSHMFERMNRWFETLSLGIDPTGFSGPLSYFAKGMVGQRVLPIMALGTTAVAADATLGGIVNDKDRYGNRVYSPFILGQAAEGVANLQAIGAGLVPGGMSYSEKKEQIFEGEVPIRSGRFWPLGSDPFMGGKIQYFRPSWYRRLKSGYLYTDDTYGSPIERLAFGYDYSPLRPFDPYHYEKKHYNTRPYPVTGEYFSGPWGPLTPALNMTIGKLLKPQRRMHEAELEAAMANYTQVGELAFANTGGGMMSTMARDTEMSAMMAAGGEDAGTGQSFAVGSAQGGMVGQMNRGLSAAAAIPSGRSANAIGAGVLAGVNARYAEAGQPSGAYGVGTGAQGQFPPEIIGPLPARDPSDLGHQSRELGYRMQELFGIYGFAFGTARQKLGFGTQDFTTPQPVLQSAGAMTSATRGFWNLNLGGLGDFPTPAEGRFANLEISELVRRFVPKERTQQETFNPLVNDMGILHPWLPGSDYFINFRTGDPYTKIPEGEMRLPGIGYERLHNLHSDQYGKYGLIDQHKILGDVAPWSQQYKAIDRIVDDAIASPSDEIRVSQTRAQVDARNLRHEFHPYQYKYSSAREMGMGRIEFAARSIWERFAHTDTYLHGKFLPRYTAQEDWERENVYGATFPQWGTPIESFIKPMFYKATQRTPIAAALTMGVVGSMFGRGKGRAIGGVIGGLSALGVSTAAQLKQFVTGNRFIPEARKKELALEEYTDILAYVKSLNLYNQALAAGDIEAANQFLQASKRTMYGADIYNGSLSDLAAAIPRRKRDHFLEMVHAPEEERDAILSTAGRLERRMYQAIWGRPVEERPDLEEYFEDRELPDFGTPIWHPNTNMEHVKIKIGQSLGLDMAQMGYYPQQINEANLVNVPYPDMTETDTSRNTMSQLRQLLAQSNIGGDVVPVRTPYPGTRVQMRAGVG